ncbi:class I SAM-dependent methyltransferase [Magnetovibrio sp. PR-2]|uniref:class I SAM-dependent methyltransferase n=1 Tax=Magnetovibrio sp. PR-2 TaxID=3120356 RepID=UPI002FCE449B
MHISTCPLCHSDELTFWFKTPHSRVERCPSCGLGMLNPQPDDATLEGIYDSTYFIGSNNERLRAQGNALKRGTARLQLDTIAEFLNTDSTEKKHPKLLEIGCGLGNFLYVADQAGFDVQGIDVSQSAVQHANDALGKPCAQAGLLEDMNLPQGGYDIVVLADVIEHVRDPKAFLAHVQTLVKPGGIIFMAAPSLDSFTARLMGRYWIEFKLEHLFYFNRKTLSQLLRTTGFEDIRITAGHKILSFDYIVGHFVQFPVPVMSPLVRLVNWVLPTKLTKRPLTIVASGINAVARKPLDAQDARHVSGAMPENS